MAGTAAIVIGGMIAGQVAQKAMAPDIPEPGTPPPVPSMDQKATDTAAKTAADKQRKTASAAGGRSSTILTGPQGLGEIGGENQQKQTLLGY